MTSIYKTGKKVMNVFGRAYLRIIALASKELENEDTLKISLTEAKYNSSKICHSASRIGCKEQLEDFVIAHENKTQIPTFLGDKLGRDYVQEPTKDGGVKLVFQKSKYTLYH